MESETLQQQEAGTTSPGIQADLGGGSDDQLETSYQVTSYWGKAWRRFKRQKASLFGFGLLLLLVLAAIFAPIVSPYDPAQQFRKEGFNEAGLPVGPSAKFRLGTDNLGRDMLSRLIYGARTTLTVGVAATLIAVSFGLVYGSLSGLVGGRIDNLLMRAVDVIMSLPGLFIIMMFVVVFGPSIWITIAVIALLSWTYPARVFRSEVISQKEKEYVLAVRSLGGSSAYIFVRHILPQLLPVAVIYIGIGVPGAIFAEAGLSFLGLGVPPPAPAWGGMMSGGTTFIRSAPWLVILPGIAIMITVVSFNLVGNGLRDALDPTLS